MRLTPKLLLVLIPGCGGWVGENHGWSDFVELQDEPVTIEATLTSTLTRSQADRLSGWLTVSGSSAPDALSVQVDGPSRSFTLGESERTEDGYELELPIRLFPCGDELCEELWTVTLDPGDTPQTVVLAVDLEVGHRGDQLPNWSGRVGVEAAPVGPAEPVDGAN